MKIAPTHAGVSVGPDGGSHQMLEDVALMRVLPNMRVLVPADYAAAARRASRLAAATPGPVYVRMGRASVPCVYADDVELELGRAYVLREGADATIVACGVEIERGAATRPSCWPSRASSAEVIDAFSVKPLDEETILASVAQDRAASWSPRSTASWAAWARPWPSCLRAAPSGAVRSSWACATSSASRASSSELMAYFDLDASRAIVEAVKNGSWRAETQV